MRYSLVHREELLGFIRNLQLGKNVGNLYLNFLQSGLCVSYDVPYTVNEKTEQADVFRFIDSDVFGSPVSYMIRTRKLLWDTLEKLEDGEIKIATHKEGIRLGKVTIRADKRIVPVFDTKVGNGIKGFPELRYSTHTGEALFSPDEVHYVRVVMDNMNRSDYKQLRKKFWPQTTQGNTMSAKRTRTSAAPAPVTIPAIGAEAIAPAIAPVVPAAPAAVVVAPAAVVVAPAAVVVAPAAVVAAPAAVVAAPAVPPVPDVSPVIDAEVVPAAAPAQPTPKDEGEVYQEPSPEVMSDAGSEELVAENTIRDEAALKTTREKAPLKKEQNSADGLLAKGWFCIPMVYPGQSSQERSQAIFDLQLVRDAYIEASIADASTGVSAEEHAEVLAQVTKLKKAIIALT